MQASGSLAVPETRLTVTVKLHEASGATPFEAAQVTVVVPTGNTCGEVMTVLPTRQVTVGVGGPVVVTLKGTDAEFRPASLPTVMLAGRLIVGGVLDEQLLRRIVTLSEPILVTAKIGLAV